MKVYVDRIARVGDSSYEVLISTSDPAGFHNFTFRVDRTDLRVVSYSDEFAKFMSLDVGALKDLMAAISALDRAQGTEVASEDR